MDHDQLNGLWEKCGNNEVPIFNREETEMKDQKNRASRKKQNGFTAVELIIVLIVGLGIITLAAGKMDMLFGNSNVSEELSNVNTLFANTRALKTSSGYGAASTDLTSQLTAVNGVPRNMAVTGGVIYNLWGGSVPVVSTGPGFTITQNTTPQEACIKMATKISKGGTFQTIAINGNAGIAGEVSSATATTQCNSATSNAIVFTSGS